MTNPVSINGSQQHLVTDEQTEDHESASSAGRDNQPQQQSATTPTVPPPITNPHVLAILAQRQEVGSPAQHDSTDPNARSEASPSGSANDDGGILETAKNVLDVASFIPVIGTAANLASAGISVAQGKYGEAALSAAAAIPVVGVIGEAAKGAKLLQKGVKAGEKLAEGGAKMAAKVGTEAAGAGVAAAGKGAEQAAGKQAAAAAGKGAEEAASKTEKTAAPAEAMAGTIRKINPQGGKTNCVNCAVATDAMLAGHPSSALLSGPQPISVIEKMFGGKFAKVNGAADIEAQLQQAGHGARGIVFGSRGAGQVGHVFNAVNQHGTVRFLDGQIGTVASFSGYSEFHFIRTN